MNPELQTNCRYLPSWALKAMFKVALLTAQLLSPVKNSHT